MGNVRRPDRVSGLAPALAPARPIRCSAHTYHQRTPLRPNCLTPSKPLLMRTRSWAMTRPHSRSSSPRWSPESPNPHPVSDLFEDKVDQPTSARGRSARLERGSGSELERDITQSQSSVVSTAGFCLLLVASFNPPALLTDATQARRRAISGTAGAHVTSLGAGLTVAAFGITPSQWPFVHGGAEGTRTPDLLVAKAWRRSDLREHDVIEVQVAAAGAPWLHRRGTHGAHG